MIMTRTLGVAGGLVIAAAFSYFLQLSGVTRRPPAVVSEHPPTAVPAEAAAVDPASVAIEDLAAWPAAAGR